MYTRILLPCFTILTLVHSFAILPSSNKKIRAPTRLFSGDTKFQKYDHTLAILTFPRNSNNQIANEAILMQAMDRTMKRLSVVIRCQDGLAHRTPIEDLRRYVGEIYSLVWDCNQSLLRTGECKCRLFVMILHCEWNWTLFAFDMDVVFKIFGSKFSFFSIPNLQKN